MTTDDVAPELNPNLFFNALADGLRLQVAGRLAQGPCALAELAEATGAHPPAVVKHLGYLQHVGPVSPLPDGRCRWRLDRIHALAAQVNTAPQPAAESAAGWERQVGRAQRATGGRNKLLVILRHACNVLSRIKNTPHSMRLFSRFGLGPEPLHLKFA